MSGKSIFKGAALLALGAGLAVAVTHVHVGWQRSEAAPAPGVAADVKAALPPPSHAQVSEARSLGRTFAQVASQLSPSVVRISVAKTVKAPAGMSRNPFGGTPFEHFFGPNGQNPNGDGDDEGGMPGQKQRGMGSGFVIDTKGNIVTNNHVVEGADEVKVTFADGKTVPGKVVGTDPKSDVAVIRVEGVTGLKPARFGDSDKMEVGEWTIAIGNPMGLDHTVTVGVLSAKGRSGFGMTQYEDFLQTDASINPGNSGGPLINLDGEVVGINTMIRGIGTGLNFAVPSSMARPIAEQLIAGGKVRRPYIGIKMQDLTPDMARAMGKASPEKGALVGEVQPGSPADKAGVHTGDVIVRVDDTKVDNSKGVQNTILRKQIGQRVELAVWRDGHEQKLAATTAELPGEVMEAQRGPGGDKSSHGKLGIALQSLTPQLAERLNMPRGTKGALIGQVRPGSPAEEAGLQQGDVILEVDRKPVHTGEEAVAALGQAREGGHMLRVQRGEGAMFLAVP